MSNSSFLVCLWRIPTCPQQALCRCAWVYLMANFGKILLFFSSQRELMVGLPRMSTLTIPYWFPTYSKSNVWVSLETSMWQSVLVSTKPNNELEWKRHILSHLRLTSRLLCLSFVVLALQSVCLGVDLRHVGDLQLCSGCNLCLLFVKYSVGNARAPTVLVIMCYQIRQIKRVQPMMR